MKIINSHPYDESWVVEKGEVMFLRTEWFE